MLTGGMRGWKGSAGCENVKKGVLMSWWVREGVGTWQYAGRGRLSESLLGLNTGSVAGDVEQGSGCQCGWRVVSLCVEAFAALCVGPGGCNVVGRTAVMCLQRWGCQCCCWICKYWGGGGDEGGMHIVERLGGATVPCRGGCRLCVHGETGLLLPPVPRGTCSPFL